MSDTLFETPFPAGETFILTESARRMFDFGELLLSQERPHTTIGIVTGAPGTGKTCAAHRLRQQVQQKYAGGEVSCSYCKVLPQCTPRMLIELLYSLLVSSLPQPASGQRKHRATQRTFVDLLSASQQFRKQLLILDEVELLHPECYDLLRQLFEETGCPFLLLGTSKLSIKIQQNALFASHIGLGMIFAPPTEHEMLLSILPQLTIPGWSFDPGSDADLELGEEIWHAVNPSLRRLMVLLQTASQLADSTNGGRITRDVLRQVFGLLAFPPKNSLSASKARKESDPSSDVFLRNHSKKVKNTPRGDGNDGSI